MGLARNTARSSRAWRTMSERERRTGRHAFDFGWMRGELGLERPV
jgi:hypothetical protein